MSQKKCLHNIRGNQPGKETIMIPGFHGLDLIVILVIALLIFGPKRLPEMGSSIGKSIKEFRKGMSELTSPKDEKEEEAKLPIASKEVKNESQSASIPANTEITASPTTTSPAASTSSATSPSTSPSASTSATETRVE
jgi:sec-independent protein translocase protein TatA